MSNKKDNNHQEYHSGKGDSQNGSNSHASVPHYQPAEQEDEIDLLELAKHFWRDRKIIAKIVGVFVIIGIFIALFSSVEYTADAVLMPQLQTSKSRAQSLLNKYGGLLGIGGGVAKGGVTITPLLYPKIVGSVPYNLQLMHEPITFAEYDTTATPYSFFQNIYSPSLIGNITKYTIGLPGVVLALFKSDEPEGKQLNLQTMERDTIFKLTGNQWNVLKTLQNRVNVQVDEQTGLVTLTAEMPDPVAAAQLAQTGIRILTASVKRYRTQKAVQNLKFIQKQVKSAKRNFNEAQHDLAYFRDNNLSLASASAKTQEQNLQSAYNLTFNLYNSLRQRLQQAKLMVQNQTPVVSILQPVTVPKDESKPQRKLIVIVFLILGIIVALGWSLIRDYGREVIREVKAGETNHDEGKTHYKKVSSVE